MNVFFIVIHTHLNIGQPPAKSGYFRQSCKALAGAAGLVNARNRSYSGRAIWNGKADNLFRQKIDCHGALGR
jgi:hypothetical protein